MGKHSSPLQKQSDFDAGKVFFHKVHLLHLEGFSVQVIQASGIGGEGEGQLIGIEGLVIPVIFFVQLAVLAVTQQRMAGVGELGPDLMGPAGDQLAFYQRQTVFDGNGLVIGLAGLGTGLRLVGNEDPILLGT